MTTEYTTMCCAFCGSTYPAKQFHTCVAFKEAVREIAREEIAKAYGGALETVKKFARDDALEDAARIAHSWNPSHYHKAAQEIRALKSQPAAQENDTMQWKPDPKLTLTVQPAAQASAFKCPACAVEFRETHECARWGAVQKERDELRAKLAEAEKVIKDAYDAVPYGWLDADGYKFVKEMLRILSGHPATIRLTPRKQEEPR